MQKRKRILLPASPTPSEHSEPLPALGHTLPKRKRIAVSVACNACRARKCGCDGKRPTCTPCARRLIKCIYVSESADERPATVIRNENKALKTGYNSLREILDFLKSESDDTSVDLLKQLRTSTETNPSALLEFIKGNVSMKTRRTTYGFGSIHHPNIPSQSGLEFELMLRHPIAYPTLIPLEIPAALLTPSPLRLAKVYRRGYPELATPMPRVQHQAEDLDTTPSSSTRSPRRILATYCDDRLSQLRISYWTKVPVTDAFAASAISLYLQTDQPILGIFDADLFLRDLIAQRSLFCSPLLVNALLYWACQAYASFEPQAVALSGTFFAEANALWVAERGIDSLPTLAAAQLLSLGSIYHGKDDGVPYHIEGIKIAKRLRLFGVPDTLTAREPHSYKQDEWSRAISHSAWGAFNWITMRSLEFQNMNPAIEFSPTLPIPGDESSHPNHDKGTTSVPSQPLPWYMGLTFPAICKFWVIISRWAIKYYGINDLPTLEHPSSEFAEDIYQQLLSWADNLPTLLARGDQCVDHSAVMHIWYHSSILNIFRPFSSIAEEVHTPFTAFSARTQGIFAASLNQLKQLIRIFDCKYGSAGYGILWHVALLQVANGMLMGPSSSEKHAYFMLCVSCYHDLFPCYRVVYSIVKGLLAMAWQKDVISGSEAQLTLAELHKVGKHHTKLDDIKTTFVVDLGLALTNPSAAQLEARAKKFDELSIFDDFTIASDYIPQSQQEAHRT